MSDTRPVGGALLGSAAVIAGATLFAVNGTVSTLALDQGISPLRLVQARCLAAAAGFVLIALLLRPGSLRARRREVGFLVVYGIIGVAMVQWLYFVAIQRLPVSVTLLVQFTAPIMVALYVRFIRGEPVRPRLWLALTLSVGGLTLVARVWAGLTLDTLGLLAATLSALALAAYYLLGEHGLGTRDPISLSAWTFVVAAVFWSVAQPVWSFPVAVLHRSAPVGLGVEVPVWGLVTWIVLLGTVVPFLLVLAGLRLIGAARTGLLGTVEPVVAGAVAWVWIGQVLAPVQVLGGAVVMAGILLALTARPVPAAAVTVAASPARPR